MNDKFLPIGTVVLLKEGKRPLMITSYCIFPTGEVYEKGEKIKSEGKIYEYGACDYPVGIVSSNKIYGFNHDQIEKIYHMGFVSEEHTEFSKKLNEEYEKFKAQQKKESKE